MAVESLAELKSIISEQLLKFGRVNEEDAPEEKDSPRLGIASPAAASSLQDDVADEIVDRLKAEKDKSSPGDSALDADAARTRQAFFTTQPLPAEDEAALLAAFPELLPLIPARINAMLDAGEWAQAERLLSRLPEADRPRVVQRFVRLENSRSEPGAGLGLSLVSAVAASHGGRLELSEGPGEYNGMGPGLRVALVLPRVE